MVSVRVCKMVSLSSNPVLGGCFLLLWLQTDGHSSYSSKDWAATSPLVAVENKSKGVEKLWDKAYLVDFSALKPMSVCLACING